MQEFMALSSFLLASGSKNAAIDTELDSLFQKATTEPQVKAPLPSSSGKPKRKHQELLPHTAEKTNKKHKAKDSHDLLVPTKKPSKSFKAPKALAKKNGNDGSEGESDDDSELEQTYLSRTVRVKGKKLSKSDHDDGSERDLSVEGENSSSNEEDEEDEPPQHETLTKKQSSKSSSKVPRKYTPPDETPEQRNARTLFVGNLSVEVSQKKSLLKSLQRHILSLIPTPSDSSNIRPKIESTRFRSVPFAVPTSTLEQVEEEPSSKKKKSKSSSKARQHDLDRTQSWKKSTSSGDQGAGDAAESEKNFLTPAQKKKIAFINQEIHASGSSVNAYLVFAHPLPTSDEVTKRRPNLPPLPEVMDPYKAARLAQEACDGSEFMERTLRVDIVSQNPDSALAETQGRVLRTGSDVDPKRCIFVGNLDFESKEEDVRAYFESVVSAEKGPRIDGTNRDSDDQDSDSDEDEDEDEGHDEKKKTSKEGGRSKGWVTRVRIIRDKDTQLGKGFAYVQFAERDCVDEILAAALEPGKLKFAKRKLRVERCKTIPGGSFKVKVKSTPSSSRTNDPTSKASASAHPKYPTSVSVPKGDPNLGAKLANLSKEERKNAKATDADRIARRLAKKKSRMAMAVGADGVKVQGKERGRERKHRTNGGGGGASGKGHGVGSATKNKGKALSERALKKRNTKK
ncbi:hypothetical protein C8R42DRAFT_778754 [Lentinula raphanica]|nr:hypothetical protein C8R42DRAFT_778754 [Lentinula raphanica]